jgi:calcineurin-like phosphoesterase family protein
MIYFTSDTHYRHSSICLGTSTWEDKSACRPFDNSDKMDYAITYGINNVVEQSDTLYILGDFVWAHAFDKIAEYRSRIICSDVHLILGNHDKAIEKYKKRLLDGQIFQSIDHYKEITIDNTKIVMSHYAMRVWNKSHKGSIMLHGHSHGNLKPYDNFKQMDVGIDTHPEFRPYSEAEIMKIMSKKDILTGVDHHGKPE